MSSRVLLVLAFVSSTLFMSWLTASYAAAPDFCEQYAHAAIIQVRGGLNNRSCAGGMQGPRWSPEWRVHFDWCRSASFAAAGAERDARTSYLKACTGQ
jgi:hypothetical protein